MSSSSIQELIRASYSIKPDTIRINELRWKYLIRSAYRGKNILLIGPTGCGKTLAAKSVIQALDRTDNHLILNMGSTQDPRTALIGKTLFDKSVGTYFNASPFVSAIQRENSIIVLDEISRSHPDAWNLLIPVLDDTQRTFRLDESVDSPIINVARGVTFIATANIGSEYTATRIMDRALLGRFTVKIEMNYLEMDEEISLGQSHYPEVNVSDIKMIVAIADAIRQSSKTGKISMGVSTRSVLDMIGLFSDGFTLPEIVEMVLYTDYSDEGGVESERTIVKQNVQKFLFT